MATQHARVRTPFTRHRLAAGLATTAVLALALAGCASSSSGSDPSASSGSDKPLKIAFANISDAATTFLPTKTAMQADAKKLGWSLSTFDNKLDSTTTLNNARLMVAQKPDVIIEFNGVDGVANALGRTFTSAHIPCIAMNGPIPGCAWFNISNPRYGMDAGANLAKSAEAKGWTAQNTTFVAINAPAAGSNPQELVANAYATFTKDFKGIPAAKPSDVGFTTTTIGSNFVQINGAATLIDSTNAMKSELQNIPAGRNLVVVTVNDDSALGALAALQSAGKKNALIAGAGSSSSGLEKLRTEPSWVSEGAVYLNEWAGYTLAMASAMKSGVKPPSLTVAPQNSLTKDTVDKYFKGDTPIAIPAISSSATYLLNTGVLQKLGMAK